MLLSFFMISVYNPQLTGLVPILDVEEYSMNVNLTFDENMEYLLLLDKVYDIDSLKVNGSILTDGDAKIYVKHNNKKILIFDSSQLVNYDVVPITGFVVSDIDEDTNNSSLNNSENPINNSNNETLSNVSIKNNSIINETINGSLSDKTITINLNYGNEDLYDPNNDGIESKNGIIDIIVEETLFSWDVDTDKLCTRWETYSLDNDEGTIVCYGNEQCCNFVSLTSSRNNWDETFYLNYGRFESTSNNEILAQVIYVDYNLLSDSPSSEIYYSEWDNVSATFIDSEELRFEGVCEETCNVNGFRDDYYELIIDDITIVGKVIDHKKPRGPVKVDIRIEEKLKDVEYGVLAEDEVRAIIIDEIITIQIRTKL